MEILSLKTSGRMLILIIVTVLTLVLETTVSRLYAFFVPGPHSLEVNLVFFAVAIVIFSCVHVLILLDIKKQIKSLFPSGEKLVRRHFSVCHDYSIRFERFVNCRAIRNNS